MKLKLIGIILMVLVAVITLGCVGEESPTKANSTQITQQTQQKIQYKDSSNFLFSLIPDFER